MTTYDFGWPDDSQIWQKMVNDAIAASQLKWKQKADTQYILAGECPRCHDQTDQIIDLEVVFADAIVAEDYSQPPDRAGVQHTGIPDDAKRLAKIAFVCLCEETTPHLKDTKGCGAGANMDIIVIDPRG